MTTTSELNELIQYVRKALPNQKHLTRVASNVPLGAVELTWHSRQFVVKPSLEVLELKGQTLLFTGASMLMQAALRTMEANSKVVAAIIDAIRLAEDSMKLDREAGLALLSQARNSLQRLMIGRPKAAAILPRVPTGLPLSPVQPALS